MDWTKIEIPGKYIAYTVALAIAAYAAFSTPTPDHAPQITERGYFKSQSRDRIYSFVIAQNTSIGTITTHGNKLPHTAHAMTAAYYYPQGTSNIPADGLTLAKNIYAANHLLYDRPEMGPWRYAYLKDRKGNTTLADCQTTPQHELCRK